MNRAERRRCERESMRRHPSTGEPDPNFLCDVCGVRPAVILDNHHTRPWRVLCDWCDLLEQAQEGHENHEDSEPVGVLVLLDCGCVVPAHSFTVENTPPPAAV